MKISDDDIKRALREKEIPEPSPEGRNETLRLALAAHEEEIRARAGKKKSKGVRGFLRHMGRTVSNLFSFQGGPIMTQRQFATVGVLVLAIGLFLSIGPRLVQRSIPLHEEIPLPPAREQPIDRISQMDERAHKAPEQPEQPAVEAEAGVRPEEETVAPVQQAPIAAAPRMERKLTAPSSLSAPKTGVAGGKANLPATTERRRQPGRIMAYESDGPAEGPVSPYYRDEGRDRFESITPNGIKLAAEEPVSTFSIDVDTASYAFVRRQLLNGVLPQKNSVRVEEMINYFEYAYPVPRDRSRPFQPTVAVYPTPWNQHTRLLHIGIKGYDIDSAEKPRSNLVFLVDVSGSMNSPDKLPLLKNGLAMLVETLRPDDTVAIVVYAGAAGVVLEPTRIAEKGKILAALDRLRAGGSTAGGAGIRLAYSLAESTFDEGAVNRVILATDGDFNVGITDREELKSFIERKRKSGVFLTVLGFGQGNYNDALMQTLAQHGNGNAAYIDSLSEARKVLVREASSTLFTIARDVKIQVEFNPARVHDYRLIGYETRQLNREDFNNDAVDAGDIGAGHAVTAIYEITPADSPQPMVDDLRYGKPHPLPGAAARNTEYAFLKIRYKLPGEEESRLITQPVTDALAHDSLETVPEDMRFAAAVAAFGQVLRGGIHTGGFGYDDVLRLAEPARGRDPYGYRAEFLNLVRLAETARAM
ncbi:MAG: VWA domain-containing protein [Desulfobulbaceae bacterium]